MKRQPGFTLIELMIAVAMIGILAAIALPAYDGAMRKSRRGTAQSFMMEIAQREQAILLDNRAYATGAGALAALGLTVPGEITSSYTFAVTEVAGGPPDFAITATATGAQDARNDEDLRLCSGACPGFTWEKARGDNAGNNWDPAKW